MHTNRRSLKFNRLIWLLTFFVIYATPGAGCMCGGGYYPVEKAFKDSDSVFTGRVTSITKGSFGKSVHFLVVKVWKGVNGATTTVETGNGSGDCGYPFEVGGVYLVYSSGKTIQNTNICTLTKPYSEAGLDVAELNVLNPLATSPFQPVFVVLTVVTCLFLLRYLRKRRKAAPE